MQCTSRSHLAVVVLSRCQELMATRWPLLDVGKFYAEKSTKAVLFYVFWISFTALLLGLFFFLYEQISIWKWKIPNDALQALVYTQCANLVEIFCMNPLDRVKLSLSLRTVHQVAPSWCLLNSTCHLGNGILMSRNLPGISQARAAATKLCKLIWYSTCLAIYIHVQLLPAHSINLHIFSSHF